MFFLSPQSSHYPQMCSEPQKIQAFTVGCELLVCDKSFKQNLVIGAPKLKPVYTLALEELSGLIRTTSVFPPCAVLAECFSLYSTEVRFKWKGSVRWLGPRHWSMLLPELNNVLMQALSG